MSAANIDAVFRDARRGREGCESAIEKGSGLPLRTGPAKPEKAPLRPAKETCALRGAGVRIEDRGKLCAIESSRMAGK
jgi:hypothetical protein